MTPNDIYPDDQLASLIPPPNEAELTALRESLRAEGLREPLRVWPHEGRRVLIDGYARLKLARELGIEVCCTELSLADRNAAMAYRLASTLDRRNLSLIAQAVLRGRLHLLVGGRQGERTDLPGHEAGAMLTAAGIAARFSVSERTIRRDRRLAEAVELLGSPEHLGPAFREQLLGGRTNLTRRGILQLARMSAVERQRVLARMEREREERRARPRRKPHAPKVAGSTESNSGADTPVVIQSRNAAAGSREATQVARRPDNVRAAACGPTAPFPASELPPDIRLHHVDNRTFEWPEIDLCFTDPPYQDLDAYSWLGEMLGRKLRPGRLALVYASPFHLPEVIGRLTGGGLRYVTTLGIVYRLASGSPPLLGFLGNNLRPVVLLSQGRPEPAGRKIQTGVVQEPSPKGLHPWQQAVEPAVEWIRRLTRPGELVADPFLGSGTTAAAVRQIGGLQFVGTEIDPKTYRTACERVATEVQPVGDPEQEIDAKAVEGVLDSWKELDQQSRLAFLARPVVQAAFQRLITSEGCE
jgi:hypothetical protein